MTTGGKTPVTGDYELMNSDEWERLKPMMRKTICGSRYVLDSGDQVNMATELMDILGVAPK